MKNPTKKSIIDSLLEDSFSEEEIITMTGFKASTVKKSFNDARIRKEYENQINNPINTLN